jgi:hypothetical protein
MRRSWAHSERRRVAVVALAAHRAWQRRRKGMASSRQKRKVGRVMKEHKRGKLRSGSGRKVKSRKQAIAIAMSESGQSRKKKKGRKTRKR